MESAKIAAIRQLEEMKPSEALEAGDVMIWTQAVAALRALFDALPATIKWVYAEVQGEAGRLVQLSVSITD